MLPRHTALQHSSFPERREQFLKSCLGTRHLQIIFFEERTNINGTSVRDQYTHVCGGLAALEFVMSCCVYNSLMIDMVVWECVVEMGVR